MKYIEEFWPYVLIGALTSLLIGGIKGIVVGAAISALYYEIREIR